MKAVVCIKPGGPEVLELIEREAPPVKSGEVLVAVRTTAVNRGDILQRRGFYPPPKGVTDVLGLEFAGEVVDRGAGVRGWTAGSRVCGIVPGGGYAELVAVPASNLLPVPERLSWEQAAALPEAFATAYDNLIVRGQVGSGETVLIHGGSSGVGTAAIQLAVAHGASVIVTASSRRKLRACRELGAAAGINYVTQDFVQRVMRLTRKQGVDVVFDIVGARYLERNISILAADGRLVIIALIGGATGSLDLGQMLTKRLTIRGSTLRARSTEEKATLVNGLLAHVWPKLVSGQLRPVVDSVYRLDEVARAHRRMEKGAHIGKIVLNVSEALSPW